MPRIRSLVLVLVALAVTAPTASAAIGDLTLAGCVAHQIPGCEQPPVSPPAMQAPGSIAASSDSRDLYVGGRTSASGAITRLRRDPATGAMHFEGCIRDGGCTTNQPGLTAIHGVVASPDGKHVYTLANSRRIDRYAVGADGALTLLGCTGDPSTGCADVVPTDLLAWNANSITIAPEGDYVYVSALGFYRGVAAFARDAATGALTFTDCLGNAQGCHAAPAGMDVLGNPQDVVAAPGSDDVYLSDSWTGGLGHIEQGADVAVGEPEHGTLSADRTTYTPDPGFTGTETLAVRAAGPAGVSNVAALTVTVTASGPVLRAAPSVVLGAPRVGRVAVALVGRWTGATGYETRWLRCSASDPADCAEIPGESRLTHRIVDADAGSRLRAEVRALSASAASLWTRSAATPVIAPRR